MSISTIELNGGEYIALGILEIESIPSLAVLKKDYSEGVDIEQEYKKSFGNLLTEIYSNYKIIYTQNNSVEISSEILWITEPVENQPYKAKVRLFILNRAISGDKESAENIVQRINTTTCENLKLQKFTYKERSFKEITGIIDSVHNERILSIVKDEKEEILHNQMLPASYSVDVLNSYAVDMAGLTESLIAHPNVAVSVQVIPTMMSQDEVYTITQYSQLLDTLSKGVMTQGIGNIAFSNAEKLSNVYKYYQNNRNAPIFSYNILIVGENTDTEDIASRLHSYINYDSSNPVSLKTIRLDEENVQFKGNPYATPWIANETIIQTQRDMRIWGRKNPYQSLYRLPYLLSAEEASGLFRLPIGNQRINAGLPVNETGSTSKTYASNLINSGDIEIGELKSSSQDIIGISLKDLAKHMLVVGTPGSGKTTFSVSLLDRLWKEHGIPFLVIEPAKNEYRALVQSIPELQVFTPGKNFISPFVFNPFVPPKNVKLETYKSTLKTAFAAAVSMTTPLDKIFEESINNCYSDFRWLDTYTVDNQGKTFNISDFIKCFQNTFDEIGYTGDAKNIGRAGVVRLNSLANLFDNYFSIPIQDLLDKPTIIELAAIENSDQKALIISLLLLSILSYVNSNYVGEGGLRNVILLEEAHVLLDADSNTSQGDANPSAIAQGLVKRMLAEIRSYGVGIVIADQSPRKVSTDVVALTDMKMVFRLVEATDKQIIADSMNMDENQVKRLSRLKPGEAFLFFNRLEEPEEVVTPDYRLDNNISITLSDEGIKELSTYWNNKKKQLRPYPQCELVPYCCETCDYNRRILAKEIARRIFVHNFKSDTKDFENLKKVFGQITKLAKAELNDEPFSQELLACVKTHLWRRIKYGTKIPVKDIQIENSLKKS
ncbi:ATP-binding protein [Intestinibacter sp.]